MTKIDMEKCTFNAKKYDYCNINELVRFKNYIQKYVKLCEVVDYGNV